MDDDEDVDTDEVDNEDRPDEFSAENASLSVALVVVVVVVAAVDEEILAISSSELGSVALILF